MINQYKRSESRGAADKYKGIQRAYSTHNLEQREESALGMHGQMNYDMHTPSYPRSITPSNISPPQEFK